MLRFLAEGFVLGLSIGLSCLVTCGPVFLAFMLREKRSFKTSLIVFGEISLGRFFGYGIFGAMAGALGGLIPDFYRNVITYIAFIAIGGIMVFYGIRGRTAPSKCAISWADKYISNPILLGFLTGLELCPPFLLAVADAVSAGGALSGFVLFTGFFAGTTIYLFPVAFFSVASNLKGFRVAAMIAAVAIGIWFFVQGASGLVLTINKSNPQQRNYSIVGVPDAPQVWIFSDSNWGDSLGICLKPKSQGNIEIVDISKADSIANITDTLAIAIWQSSQEIPKSLSDKIGVIKISEQLDSEKFAQICEFLSSYYFKRRYGKGFVFDIKMND